MAWETRHIKVQALNDSQYIGICVYSAVFSAIITVLTSFMDEYVVLNYLAKTTSILASTTLTLFLLFLPKFKSVFGRHNSLDPVMQSMGLKIEYNTRRFITNDPKEQILRLEIQNKVYKCELAALDLEITRLENLLQDRRSSGIFTVFKEEYVKLDNEKGKSCSWPVYYCKSQDNFFSENKLNERKSIIDEMRHHFINNIRIYPKTDSLLDHEYLSFCATKYRNKSHPEFYHKCGSKATVLTRAKSELDFSLIRSFK